MLSSDTMEPWARTNLEQTGGGGGEGGSQTSYTDTGACFPSKPWLGEKKKEAIEFQSGLSGFST